MFSKIEHHIIMINCGIINFHMDYYTSVISYLKILMGVLFREIASMKNKLYCEKNPKGMKFIG